MDIFGKSAAGMEFIKSLIDMYTDVLVKVDINESSESISFMSLTDEQYMRMSELKFLAKNIRELTAVQLYSTYSKSDSITYDTRPIFRENSARELDIREKNLELDITKRSTTDKSQLISRIKQLDEFLVELQEYIELRIKCNHQQYSSIKSSQNLPRLLKLCQRYKLTPVECNILHVMVIVQGSSSSFVLNQLLEEDYVRRMTGFQRLAGMAEVDIDAFCDQERQHIKEGFVLVEDENGIHYNLRCTRTAVKLLYGRQVDEDELLKIAQTTLETILLEEKQDSQATSDLPLSVPSAGNSATVTPEGLSSPLSLQHLLSTSSSTPLALARRTASKQTTPIGRPSLKRKLSSSGVSNGLISKVFRRIVPGGGGGGVEGGEGGVYADEDDDDEDGEESDAEEGTAGEGAGEGLERNGGEDEDEDDVEVDPEEIFWKQAAMVEAAELRAIGAASIKPYPSSNQLEYLEEAFQVVALLIRANAAKIKDDMKKEGTKINAWDGGEVKHGRREIQAKLRVQEARMQRRVQATTAARLPLPRLEELARRLGLDAFEKKIVLLLVGKTVSPVVKTLMDNLDNGLSRPVDDCVTVGQALAILSQDFATQIAYRKYFYMSGKLVSNGLVSLSKSRWHQGSGDLTDNRMVLDRRVLDWTVGLDTEINELVEGSDLYEPKVRLSQVVLPSGQLDLLQSHCTAYDSFLKYRKQRGLDTLLTYGNGLVVLLCGKSGTGKTMTVNAMAHELGKKVLLVDFGGLYGRKDGAGELDADLRGLFREAQMNNAVLFFDECETIFRSRSTGGDRLLNSLLTQIEKHEGIVFLATNRPYDLDEAMHRRITMVVEYRSPTHVMRRAIWEILLGIDTPLTSTLTNSTSSLSSNSTSAPVNSHQNTNSGNSINAAASQPAPSQPQTIPLSPSSNPSIKAGKNKKTRLSLGADVDVGELAVKYEMTGGLIKNAVLSALLMALSRNPSDPVICQQDLVHGCKLQMRGSLSAKTIEDKIQPTQPLSALLLVPSVRDTAEGIVRMERARARVYGSMSRTDSPGNGSEPGSATLSSYQKENGPLREESSSNSHSMAMKQRATICAFAGPAGCGKKTLVKAVAFDLGRNVKLVHAAELVVGAVHDTLAAIEQLMQDARLSDSVLVVDGFEHLLDESVGAGDGGWKLHLLLSKLLSTLSAFPGCVILICHIDSPMNVTLQRDFASRLFCFLRFQVPSHDIRAKLWRGLVPPHADLAKDVSFQDLGRRFELYSGGILSAVLRATSEAAMRDHGLPSVAPASTSSANPSVLENSATATPGLLVRQKDLVAAGEAEVNKQHGVMFDITAKMFA